MNKSQQVALLGTLLALIVAIGGWRTWSAMHDTGPKGRHLTNAEWQQHLEVVSIDREAPEGFVPTDHPNQHCAGLPNVVLAKLRWRDQLSALEWLDSMKTDGLPFPIHNKVNELNGNCVLKGGIDDRGKDLEAGEGWVELSVAVTHTGKVPFAKVPRRHQPMCIIIEVPPGSGGERAGLKVGDVVVGAGDFDLSSQPGEGDVCVGIVAAMDRFGPQQPYVMKVVKDGALIEVPRMGGEKFGIRFTQVPVLDADLTP